MKTFDSSSALRFEMEGYLYSIITISSKLVPTGDIYIPFEDAMRNDHLADMFDRHITAGTAGNIKEVEGFKQQCGKVAKEILLDLDFKQLEKDEVLPDGMFFKKCETYIKL